jgi:hypothetical protein
LVGGVEVGGAVCEGEEGRAYGRRRSVAMTEIDRWIINKWFDR